MKINANFSGNALTISDDQVAADWTLGMIRAASRRMAAEVKIMRPSNMYGWQSTVDWDATRHFMGEDACSISSVVDIEDGVWEDSAIDGTVEVFATLSATVTCACGTIDDRNGQAFFDVGSVFSTVANG